MDLNRSCFSPLDQVRNVVLRELQRALPRGLHLADAHRQYPRIRLGEAPLVFDLGVVFQDHEWTLLLANIIQVQERLDANVEVVEVVSRRGRDGDDSAEGARVLVLVGARGHVLIKRGAGHLDESFCEERASVLGLVHDLDCCRTQRLVGGERVDDRTVRLGRPYCPHARVGVGPLHAIAAVEEPVVLLAHLARLVLRQIAWEHDITRLVLDNVLVDRVDHVLALRPPGLRVEVVVVLAKGLDGRPVVAADLGVVGATRAHAIRVLVVARRRLLLLVRLVPLAGGQDEAFHAVLVLAHPVIHAEE
mmetsp:Transcript_13125/g.38163  ORF Transcript_13125/g.38163 Transcript_13125/m.38163 type:complete len:305 (+) Transcript_13125:354-1268(+)